MQVGSVRTFRQLFMVCALCAAAILPSRLDAAENPADAVQQTYIIRDIRYDITGSTKQFALRYRAGLKIGEILAGKAALEEYLKEKNQLLHNERVLESASVDYVLGSPEAGAAPDSPIPVDLLVTTRDTWNIIALPYFKYDSSQGLELSLKGRDYNFFGTMEALRIDLGYSIDRDPLNARAFNEGAFFADVDINVPFALLNLDWYADFDHYIAYTSKGGPEYRNTTGIRLSLPYGPTTVNIGAYQGLSVNEKNGAKFRAVSGERYNEYWYLSNWLNANWVIPTGIKVNGFGALQYIPGIELKLNYRPGGAIGEERSGPTGNFNHRLAFGRIDWIGNYRRGLEASLGNTTSYNLYTAMYNRSVEFKISAHYPGASFFGVSSRVSAVYYADEANGSAAAPIRGVMDDSVSADYAAYLNVDLPLRVIRFVPSRWFGKSWMRFFDFEQHWSPFVDVGLVNDTLHGRKFTPADAVVGGGLEVVTFPLFMRSLYLRISLGFDLRKAVEIRGIPDGNDRGIFIGLGHHY